MTLPAVILAAGRGSRLGSLTQDRPKCLVELAGLPLLRWQLKALARAGVTDIRLVAGYLQQCIEGPFAKVVNPRWAETNMVASLACADELLRERPCLVAYSDIVYRHEHLRRLAEAPGHIVITSDALWEPLWRLRFGDPLADAEVFRARGGQLEDIGAKPRHLGEIQGQYMGLLKIAPQGWKAVRRVLDGLPQDRADALDLTSLLGMLARGGTPVDVVQVDGGWVEVDCVQDLLAYEQALDLAARQGRRFSHDWRED